MTAAEPRFDWPAETLADMQARRRMWLAHAAEADRNGEPGIAIMYEKKADEEDERIARHMSGVAHRAARIQHDRDDVPEQTEGTGAVAYLLGAVLIVAAIVAGIPAYAMLLVWLGGVAT